ncbi:MAG: transposase [Flavobacteriaceae bacterium]|nr:transposase [Flavobacteriaceae bacterium]
MYKVLDKDTIEMEIVPHIPLPKRGFAPTAPLYEIINAILYKLKTGVQWEYLPTSLLFSQKVLSWQSVYYHYRKWCRSGTFLDCWIGTLKALSGKMYCHPIFSTGTMRAIANLGTLYSLCSFSFIVDA